MYVQVRVCVRLSVWSGITGCIFWIYVDLIQNKSAWRCLSKCMFWIYLHALGFYVYYFWIVHVLNLCNNVSGYLSVCAWLCVSDYPCKGFRRRLIFRICKNFLSYLPQFRHHESHISPCLHMILLNTWRLRFLGTLKRKSTNISRFWPHVYWQRRFSLKSNWLRLSR